MPVDVVQHCFGAPHTGGPATALARMQEICSPPFPELWQREPARGVSLRLLWRFITQLRRLRPQLLHVRGLGNEGFHAVLAGRLAGVPKILLSVHGSQRDLIGRSSLRRQLVVQVLERATLKMADAIVTVCDFAAQRAFLEPYRAKMLAPVPNGVSLPVLQRTQRAPLRSRLAIGQERVVAVVVARLTAQKGFADLAAALHCLDELSGSDGFELMIVGGGDVDGSIAAAFAGLKKSKAHFVGQQNDVSPYLEAADFFVLPSWHENLSNALLEAMAYGLPVVATAVGGNVEVLRDGGGVLVAAHDSAALAGALARMASDADQRRNLGQVARRTVEKRYSVQMMLANWRERYATVLQSTKGRIRL